MSRRKQSAPCKVEGANEGLDLRANPAAVDYTKPLTALKVPINHNSQEKKITNFKSKGINGVLMSLAAMAPRQLTVTGQNEQSIPLNFKDLMKSDEQITSYVNNCEQYSDPSQVNDKPASALDDCDAFQSIVTDVNREDTPSPMATDDMDSDDTKKGRFSARLRAKNIMKTEEKMSESLVHTLTLQNCDQALNLIKIPASMALSEGGQADDIYQQNLANQRRKLSSDEELTCPICNKTFMSKYGLLTHVEIHGTPELKCVLCNLSFTSRTSFVAHQLVAHLEKSQPVQPAEQFLPAPAKRPRLDKGNLITGFGDLNTVEFSCKKFSLISEGICSSTKCRLTEKDLGHFFVCKACSKSFPTLQALSIHVDKLHQNDTGSADSKDSELNELPAADVDEEEKKCESFMNNLGLKPSKPRDTDNASTKQGRDPIVEYGKHTELICTSPMLAYTNVPGWFRSSDSQKQVDITTMKQDLFNLNRRPSLKIKLVRKRSNERKFEHGFDRATPNYFVDGNNGGSESSWSSPNDGGNKSSDLKGVNDCVRDSSGYFTCKYCGDKFTSLSAIGGHRAASMCGIGVRSSVNGRKMYWCRLCNYASFEKSTIMRHQRTHTGVRPYSCKICALAFTTKANCERHIRKRHGIEIGSDSAVKDSVLCDYDLLKKARSGELNCALPAANSNNVINSQDKFFSFQCRICKTSFSSRSNGTRHVMTKHGIINRKGANEMVMCVRVTGNAYAKLQLQSGFQSDGVASNDFLNSNDDQSNPVIKSRNFNVTVANKRSYQEDGDNSTESGGKKLTPLTKLKAFHVAASELHSMLQTDFGLVINAFDMEGGKEIIDENRRLSGSLVTLFNSASTELLKRKISNKNKPERAPNRNFFDCPHCPALFVQADDLTTHVQEIHKEVKEGDSPIQDFAQMFADGQLGDTSSSSPDDKDSDYHLLTSPRKQWKLSPLPLSLRNFAASSREENNQEFDENEKDKSNEFGDDSELLDLSVKSTNQNKTDLASVEEIIDFSYKTNFTPIEGARNTSKGNSYPAKLVQTSSRITPSGSGIRGKYQMVVFPSKSQKHSVVSGIGLNRVNKNQSLTWKFIPTSSAKDVKTMFIRKAVEVRNPNPTAPRDQGNSLSDDVTQSDVKFLQKKSFPASEELVREISKSNYRHDDLPTMVPLSGSNISGFQSMAENEERMTPTPNHRRHYKPRKCPKCDKSFPWASSLRRHIMTHTGLKPFMCSRCMMRFTTRSNLLRHAYRRHGLPRGSDDRNGLIVNLSVEDQEEFALQEASKIEDHEKKFGKFTIDKQGKTDDTEKSFTSEQTFKTVQSPDLNSAFSNKRYVCGLCSVPFANRSNLVRHLQRLHDITKDHPNFKNILVKIENAFSSPSQNASPSASPHLSILPSDPLTNDPDAADPEEMDQGSPGSGLPSLFTSPRKDAVGTPDRFPDKFKAFKCSICMVGFTKRNNAARHLQHQHNISRKTTTASDLIIRVEAPTSPSQGAASPSDPRSPASADVTPQLMTSSPIREITEIKQEVIEPDVEQSFEQPEMDIDEPNLVIEEDTKEENNVDVDVIPASNDPKPSPEDGAAESEDAPVDVVEIKEAKEENDEVALPWKARRRSASRKKLEEEESKRSPKMAAKTTLKTRSNNKSFVCGVCRRSSRDVEELKKHLEEHNIPHPWHCPLCGAPFTSKYNCQRHIYRRHGSNDTEPKYVEDIRHGPRHYKKKPRVFGRY